MCLLTGFVLTILACIELHSGSAVIGGLLLLAGCTDMCCGEYITVVEKRDKMVNENKEDE